MTLLDANDGALHLSRPGTPDGRYYGVYPATVADNQDPQNQGRVLVHFPWSPDPAGDRYEAWARLSTLMAGNNRGSWFIPDKEDEVLVSFLAGDPRCPYVIGALWNGQDTPPRPSTRTTTSRPSCRAPGSPSRWTTPRPRSP